MLLYNHTEPVQGKEVLPRFTHPHHLEFEGVFCRFELKSVTHMPFELLDDAGTLAAVLVELDTQLFGLVVDIALSGEIGDQNPTLVSHRFRVDMFVGLLVLDHSTDVDPPFVGKRAPSYIGELVVGIEVGHFTYKTGKRCERVQLLIRHTGVVLLELKVRNDRTEIGIAAPLAIAVDSALHMGTTRRYSSH